jgi:hypothetical protein
MILSFWRISLELFLELLRWRVEGGAKWPVSRVGDDAKWAWVSQRRSVSLYE